MSELVQKATDCFKEGFNCAQAVFSTCSSGFNLDKEQALKLSCPFGSGMGGLQNTCGAVIGGFMAIGLKHGKYKKDDNDAKKLTYQKVREFAAEFDELHGSLNCRELIGCDISTPEGVAQAREQNLFETKCLKYVKDAVSIWENKIA